jgi:lincosamide nucleotidyltransferase A/C/D/E
MTPEPEGMSGQEVVRIVNWIESHRVCYQINGGWAVDALVGHQTRAHRDLDLFVDADAVPALLNWLRTQGYLDEIDWLPARVELRHGHFRVDVHPMTLDSAGNGSQCNAEGEIIYRHPSNARTVGMIGGHPVCVATAQRLQELRQGYQPRDVDDHDLWLLRDLERSSKPVEGPRTRRPGL